MTASFKCDFGSFFFPIHNNIYIRFRFLLCCWSLMMSYSILLCSIDMFLSDVILSLSSSFCLNYDLFFSFLTLSYHTRSFNSIYLQQFWTTFPFGFRLDIRYPSNMERMPCVSSLPPLSLIFFPFSSFRPLIYSTLMPYDVMWSYIGWCYFLIISCLLYRIWLTLNCFFYSNFHQFQSYKKKLISML